MKKKLIAVTAAVCALAVLVIGSTFAFFTSKDSASNTFTMGDLKIKVTETQNPENGKTGEIDPDGKSIKYTDALPGDTFSKEPVITNEGKATAWIRVKVEVTSDQLDDEHIAGLEGSIVAEMENNGWVDGGDGYVYYTVKALKAGESITAFKTVYIPAEWGNEVAGASFKIEISAQAVQSDNNGADAEGYGNWENADWEINAADLEAAAN